jgi:outer membrane protein OmpA-like peptidoglycan-associated protein
MFGSGLSLGTLTEDVNAKALAALNALKPGFGHKDVANALNLTVINFPTGNAEFPAFNRAVLNRAAAVLNQLPAGTTVIEISGHTDNVGDEASNMRLSQQRAEAVRAVLIEAGAPEGMLTARGYGSTRPKASNDTAEGRYQNRRIEYAVQ